MDTMHYYHALSGAVCSTLFSTSRRLFRDFLGPESEKGVGLTSKRHFRPLYDTGNRTGFAWDRKKT
jgi:hypothetical protein